MYFPLLVIKNPMKNNLNSNGGWIILSATELFITKIEIQVNVTFFCLNCAYSLGSIGITYN